MKIATVIVGTDIERFGRVGANPERLALASRIARFVKSVGSSLCVMPAGYLASTGGTTAAIRSTAEQLASIFAVDLIAGIDVARTTVAAKYGSKQPSPSGERQKRPRGGWPFWGIISRRGRVESVYQQRTVHPGEEADDVGARVVDVTCGRVGLLLCGEVYNAALAESLGHARPDFAVDIGHRSMGRGFTWTLRNAAAAVGCRVFHAQHVVLSSRCASKWTGTSRRAWMETDSDWASYAAGDDRKALWAEVKLWELER